MINFYRRSIVFLVYTGFFLLVGSCEMIEYSPHQVRPDLAARNLNAKYAEEISKLGLKPGDTVRFALIADTQRFYDETEKFVEDINIRTEQKGKRIHFVMHGGDYTDFGLIEEFQWIHQILKKLKMPYLTVLGNHDCVANGKKIYKSMFGDYDFTVDVARNRFIFVNTNSREFEESIIPLEYMEGQLKDKASYDNAFVVSHIAPFDVDFEESKKFPFAKLLQDYDVRYSFHGHNHSFRLDRLYEDPITRYLTIGSVDKYKYVVVTVVGTKVNYEIISFK